MLPPEIFGKLENLLTVYSVVAGIDPTKASRAVLMAIPGIDAQIVDNYLLERQTAADNNEPAPVFPAQTGIPFDQSAGNVYSIESQGVLKSGATATLFTTIRMPESTARGPYEMLSWKKMFGNNQHKNTEASQEQDNQS